MINPNQINLYTRFRKELDQLCIPKILASPNINVQDIVYKNKVVGIFCVYPNYIDCVYILPEYRRKGLAKKTILEWFSKHRNQSIRLHIINNNEVAKVFWHQLFDLRVIDFNPIDALYEIVNIKEE